MWRKITSFQNDYDEILVIGQLVTCQVKWVKADNELHPAQWLNRCIPAETVLIQLWKPEGYIIIFLIARRLFSLTFLIF